MPLTSLTYASVSRLKPATACAVVEALVAASRTRNATYDITGALLFTGAHFVQVLEGPAAMLDVIWLNLLNDSRHDGLVMTSREPLTQRRFGGWDLAYSGPAQFVESRVRPMFDASDPAGQRRAARWLVNLMYQFTQN